MTWPNPPSWVKGELFPVWRYHPFFTDQPAATLQAEREHAAATDDGRAVGVAMPLEPSTSSAVEHLEATVDAAPCP